MTERYPLTKHFTGVLYDNPFYGHILRRVKASWDESIPTMGVCIRNNRLCIVANPHFVKRFEDQGDEGKKILREVIKHEVLHFVFYHLADIEGWREYPQRFLNICQDLAINSLLDKELILKAGGVYPGEFCGGPGGELIQELEPKRSTDVYISRLKQNIDKFKDYEFDLHGIESLTPAQKAIVKNVLKNAVRDSKRDRSWGNLSGEIQARVLEATDERLPWFHKLRIATKSLRSYHLRSSIMRPNRRFPMGIPGYVRENVPHFLVALDQSGSCNDEDQARFYGCVDYIAREAHVDVIHFDCGVNENSLMSYRPGMPIQPLRTNEGGTLFSPITEWYNERKYDALMILTDGQSSEPVPAKGNRLWVLLPGCKLNFTCPPGDMEFFMD